MRARRRPFDDELVIDGELVVLLDGTVVVLSEVASAALDQLVTDRWTSVEDLSRHLESTVGLPDDGDAAVGALLTTLADGGLVVVQP
jgi:hypothetical protein